MKFLHKPEEAILAYKKAIDLDKSLDLPIEGIGKIQLSKGNFKDGIVNLRKANGSITFDYTNSGIIIN